MPTSPPDPFNLPKQLQPSDLRSLLSKVSHQQNLLAAVPPHLRGLPIVVLAGAGFFGMEYIKDPSKALGPAGGVDAIQVGEPGTVPLLDLVFSNRKEIAARRSLVPWMCGKVAVETWRTQTMAVVAKGRSQSR